MSQKLPRITAKQIIKVLKRKEFYLARQSGRHKIFKNQAGRRVTVPFHSGKVLHPKVLKSILQDMGISIKELREAL